MKIIQKFSVTPMLHYIDHHCRHLYRMFTQHAILYTEMIIENIMLHLNPKNIKKIKIHEHLIAIPFSWIKPKKLAFYIYLAHLSNYDEINLNIGCPSLTFKKWDGSIYLLNNIPLIIQIIQAMSNKSPIPVSIKTRISLDLKEAYSFLYYFINEISKHTDCNKFIIHARKALSSRLTTKKNRNIPSLNYTWVYQLKKDFPYLIIILNGEINSIEHAKFHLKHVAGIMIGRTIYKDPSTLTQINTDIFNIPAETNPNKKHIKQIFKYIEKN